MIFNMKFSCLNLVGTILLTLIGLTSFAQMVPMNNTIRTPYGNVNSRYYVPGPNMHYGNGAAQKTKTSKFLLEITIKEDSVVTISSSIYMDKDTTYLVVKTEGTKKRKIFPHETLRIRKIYANTEPIDGIVTDSCWMFRVTKGAINGYSKIPLSNQYISLIQQGTNGPIIPLTKENLEPLISNDEKAMRLLKKNNLKGALLAFNSNKPQK